MCEFKKFMCSVFTFVQYSYWPYVHMYGQAGLSSLYLSKKRITINIVFIHHTHGKSMSDENFPNMLFAYVQDDDMQ